MFHCMQKKHELTRTINKTCNKDNSFKSAKPFYENSSHKFYYAFSRRISVTHAGIPTIHPLRLASRDCS